MFKKNKRKEALKKRADVLNEVSNYLTAANLFCSSMRGKNFDMEDLNKRAAQTQHMIVSCMKLLDTFFIEEYYERAPYDPSKINTDLDRIIRFNKQKEYKINNRDMLVEKLLKKQLEEYNRLFKE